MAAGFCQRMTLSRVNQGFWLGGAALLLALVGFYLTQRVMFHRWQLWYQLQSGSPAQALVLTRQASGGELPTVTYRFQADEIDYFYTEAVEREVWEELNPGSIVQIEYALDDDGRLYAQIKGNSRGLLSFTIFALIFWGGELFLVYLAVRRITGKKQPPATSELHNVQS